MPHILYWQVSYQMLQGWGDGTQGLPCAGEVRYHQAASLALHLAIVS